MNFTAIIQYLFPMAVWGTDYRLYYPAGSTTPQITLWNAAKLGAQPSIATLEAAWPSVQVSQARVTQIAALTGAYNAAAYAPVSYMGTTFPCNESVLLLLSCTLVQAGTPEGLPAGFAWFDAGAKAVSMTLAELQALGNLIFTQFYPSFAKLQGLIVAVNAATTVATVQAVVWS